MGKRVRPELSYAWAPQEGPQKSLIDCPVFEIMYGGARGGGKTDGMLGKFGNKQKAFGENVVGVFFRRTREDLKEAVERSKQIYGPMGAKLTNDRQWKFPNGARLKFEYLDRDKDADNYQGHNYTDLFFEELTHWPDPTPINKLKATLRSPHGIPCQFHATSNPGGPGHGWVKSRYIDPAPGGYKVIHEDFENPFTGEIQKLGRVFIPSRLTDNSFLMKDPLYVARLQQSGSKELVRAWLEGDWDIIIGAYFDCWNEWKAKGGIIKPFAIPDHWLRFRSFDWGSSAPFSVGWWAVASEYQEQHRIPKGALVRYREWYGASAPNKGLKMTADAVADGIRERTVEKISYSVADPAIFAVDGGPSIAERMIKHGVTFMRADNKRVGDIGHAVGWDQVRARFEGDDRPMMYVFDTCTDFIRTMPALQHDEKKPEDLDTTGEDHVADEVRYACMSRPWVKPLPVKPEDAVKVASRAPTFNQMLESNKRRRVHG